MSYIKFQEYLERKKKVPVEKVPDYKGKVVSSPDNEDMHKNAGGKGQKGKQNPYKSGQDAKDPNKGKLSDGFATKGDKKLKYEPSDALYGGTGNVSKSEQGVPGGKKVADWPKTKTQEWVDRTKSLSLAEFTKKIREENLKGVEDFEDTPHDSIQKTVSICNRNKKYISDLVREMKRNRLFGKLMKEMMNHPETFENLTELMQNESYSHKFSKLIHEMVGPPIGGEDDKEMNKSPKSLPSPSMGHDDMDHDEDHEDMDHDDHDDMGHDDMDHDDHDDMGHDDMDHDDHDDEDHDDMGHDDEDHDDMDHDDHDDMGHDDMDHDDHDIDLDHDHPSSQKISPHQKLMNAMKNHPAFHGK
jgi:hypothetical protein